MRAIGIDLGTTNSAAAVADSKPQVLPSRGGEQLTPSVVSYYTKFKANEGEIVVGRQAVANAVRDPLNTVFSIKRLMGRLYGEPWQVYDGHMDVDKLREHVSYGIEAAPPADAEDQGVKVLLGGEAYSPTRISAMILRQIKADAEQALGTTITHAVITVPAYFTERQRDATRKAGELAGLKVLRILDEPTAAALAFGLGKEQEKHRVLVFDLGGGTFDISIIQMRGGQYIQLGIEGNNWLGGDDFDLKIVDRIVDRLKEEFSVDPSNDKGFLVKAKEEAEKTKKSLSTMQSADIFMPLLKFPDVPGVVDLKMTLSRQEFEADIQPLVQQAIELVHRALDKASLKPENITEVLMVGGSTAVPAVQAGVASVFGPEKVKRHVNPMECVAIGAAIHASSCELPEDEQKSTPKTRVWQTTAMNLGIAAVEGDNPDTFAVIIPKGTSYPLAEPMTRVFYPSEEDQTLIRVPVFEGLNALASLNEQQGVIEFPLGEGISTTTPVKVSFNYDENRVLTVEIRIADKELCHKETLRHDRPRVQPPTLLEDWREELVPSIRAGRHFLEIFGEYMEASDRQELQDAIERGDQALDANDQNGGSRAMHVLHHKLVSSGVASQLFLAERAMSGASREDTLTLSQATARLRLAHKNRNMDEIQQITRDLKMKVAQVLRQRMGVVRVEDKRDLNNLLRMTGASQ